MSTDIIRFRLTGTTRSQLRAFAEETGADLGCRAVAVRSAAGFSLDAYLPEDVFNQAQRQQRNGITLEFIENFSQASRNRRSEVSGSNRYINRGSLPNGLGVKE